MVSINEPLVCNRNSLHHYDYGIPVVSNKSTDYRTTTGSSHGLVPENPDEFDCRVKPRLREDWRYSDLAVKDAALKSTTRTDYITKHSQSKGCDGFIKAPRYNKDFTRNVEEKMFAAPPMPIAPKISEMKDNIRMNYLKSHTREVMDPATTAICPIQGLGRDEQPPLRPEKPGSWKWLDPYLTTNRSSYTSFSKNQWKDAKKDFPTLYNTCGKWRGFDGLLPPPSGNKTVIDPVPFRYQLPNRIVPKTVKRVPNFGIKTEYSTNYRINTESDLVPFIQVSGEEFPESLSEASAWQNLAAPGMYCTEYCQIGTGRSARNIMRIDKPQYRSKFTIHY